MPGIYGDVDLSELDRAPSENGGAPASSTQPQAQQQAPDETQPIPGAGALLEEPDESKVFKSVEKIVKGQERLAKNRAAAGRHWSRVRRGVPFSELHKSEDKAEWKAILPPGVSDTAAPIPNKADDLCSRVVSQIVVDPFVPNPKPENDSDRARGAADVAKRFLQRDGDVPGLNDIKVVRDAVDIAQTRASTFSHQWTDMEGGGWRPLQIMAHPQAIDPNNPLVGPDGNTTTDHQLRYVGQGQFVADPSQADRQWLPAFREDLLWDAHVRTVPETKDVENASAVILLMVEPLSEAKRRFPVLRDMPEEQIKVLTDWRPPRPKELVPQSLRGRLNGQTKEAAVSDESLIFWYHKYCRSGVDYPDGAEIAVNGGFDGVVLKRATLRDDVEVNDGRPEVTHQPVVRMIPVSQCLALADTDGMDPFGARPIEKFGGANEARAQIWGSVLADLDRRLHPNVFLSGMSTIQGWQLTQRTDDPIIMGGPDDKPEYEQFANFPSNLDKFSEQLDADMEAAAGLSDTAMGLSSPNAVSGVAKEAEVRQAKVALAQLYQNTVAFVKRRWAVKTQLAQCKLTVPQQVKHSGDDGAFKQKWWTGSDMVGVGEISIKPGSGTMMSPGEKQQFLGFAQGQAWITPEEAADVGRSTIADDLGVGKSRHEELIERQLAAWSEGPPQGWMPARPAMSQPDPLTGDPGGQPMLDPMTGQPAMQPPSWTPFEPRPTDDDPEVARVYYRKLRDFVPSADYTKHPPEWRALVDERYLRARQAAGVATIAEQQMAAQQQQALQMQGEADKQAQGSADKDKDRAFKGEQAEQDRAQQRSESAEDRALQVALQPPEQAAA